MDVEDVDIVRAQFLEGCLDGNMHSFDAVTGIVNLLRYVRGTTLEVNRILYSQRSSQHW